MNETVTVSRVECDNSYGCARVFLSDGKELVMLDRVNTSSGQDDLAIVEIYANVTGDKE